MPQPITSASTVNFRNVDDLVVAELGSDPSARVAGYLTQSAKERRNANELERQGLEQQLAEVEQKQVDDMYEQADHVLAAGIYRGAAQIASGVLGIESATASTPVKSASLAGSAKVVEGAGNIMGAAEDAEAKRCEADAAAHGSAAGHLERRLKEVEENASDARTQEQKAIDAAAQAVEGQSRAAQATLFIRG